MCASDEDVERFLATAPDSAEPVPGHAACAMLHATFLAPGPPDAPGGTLHLQPRSSWNAGDAWEAMLEAAREYARTPALSASGTHRRVICVREVCALPRHAQHALCGVVERGWASSLFVLVARRRACVDVALLSRLEVLRRPHFALAPVASPRAAQAAGVLARVEDVRARAAASSRIAGAEHKLAQMDKLGAVVGAAAAASAERLWRASLT